MSAGGYDLADPYESDEVSLSDYWALVRRRRLYVIAPALFALGLSLAISLSTTPMYRAKAEVLVEAGPEVGQVSGEEAVVNNVVSNELARAAGPALQEAARAEVGDEPQLSVDRADQGDVLVFTAESQSASRAAEAANAYADTYVERRRESLAQTFEDQARALEDELADAEGRLDEISDPTSSDAKELISRITELRSRIEESQTAARLAVERGAEVVNAAEKPDGPFSPRPLRNAILALLVGLIVGLAAAFLRDRLDNSIRVPEGLERATKIPVSAVIPRLKGWKKSETHIVVIESPTTPQAEAYRALRARIQFRRVDNPISTILVTSPRPGEGKTTTSTNLAVAFAAAGENTVFVDLDLRRPRAHKFFSIPNTQGVSTVLEGGELAPAINELPSVPNLSVIPAGPPTALSSELLNSGRLGGIIHALRRHYSVVIIDTPPVLAVADPLTISRHVDGVLLVVSASGTNKRDAEFAAKQLAEIEAPMIGAVLNNYSASQSGYSYSYAYSDYDSAGTSAPAPTLALAESQLRRLSRSDRKLPEQQAEHNEAIAEAVDSKPIQELPPEVQAQGLQVVDHEDVVEDEFLAPMNVVSDLAVQPSGGHVQQPVSGAQQLEISLPEDIDSVDTNTPESVADTVPVTEQQAGLRAPIAAEGEPHNAFRLDGLVDPAHLTHEAEDTSPPTVNVSAVADAGMESSLHPVVRFDQSNGQFSEEVKETTNELGRDADLGLAATANPTIEQPQVAAGTGEPALQATEAESSQTIEMTVGQVQSFLREELRKAKQVHQYERSEHLDLPTIKVVLVADDEPGA